MLTFCLCGFFSPHVAKPLGNGGTGSRAEIRLAYAWIKFITFSDSFLCFLYFYYSFNRWLSWLFS